MLCYLLFYLALFSLTLLIISSPILFGFAVDEYLPFTNAVHDCCCTTGVRDMCMSDVPNIILMKSDCVCHFPPVLCSTPIAWGTPPPFTTSLYGDGVCVA